MSMLCRPICVLGEDNAVIITPIEHGLSYVGKSSGPRSTHRVHMSDIYGSLFKELEPKRFNSGVPMNPLHLEMGLAWENMLEDGLKERLHDASGEESERPGELVTEEGIVFSPDLILYNGVTRLGEIKLTWMSSREMPRDNYQTGFPPKFDKWLVQMKSYAYQLETPYARLYAFFVNGEYAWMRKGADRSQPGGPQLMAWDLEFTKRELTENWQMMIQHAKHAGLLDRYGRA